VEVNGALVACDAVVNCAGIWSPQIGPWQASRFHPTRPSSVFRDRPDRGLSRHIPTIRDTDKQTYFKEEVGGLVVGFYEASPIPYPEPVIPAYHEFKLMPENLLQVEPLLDRVYFPLPGS